MSGHSKWAGIKHKKAVVDARRGKLFAKLIRAVEVAARDSGGNPDFNPTLADAVQRARDASMPGDTIDRAIKRGTGELAGVSYETLTYEGYAAGGVAVLCEVLTDNRNRAAADVRKIFNKHGGNLGEPGSVAWMFTKRGVVILPSSAADEDSILGVVLDAGAEDVKQEGDSWSITCLPSGLTTLRTAIESAGWPIESSQISLEPNTTIPLDAPTATQVLHLIDELEDSDDVQAVYSNFDAPEDLIAELAG
jgi:YebC/PmpR family DNA-binding regulatory protein